VTRGSGGAQSCQPRHLATLERRHDPENVAKAIEAAKRAGIQRQSVDLIYAIPGQTLDEWVSDLRTATAIGTTHVSCYNLTYEPNTAMTARLRAGEFEPVGEELEIEMFEATETELWARGLHRYEVSNYAKPGDECRHNLAYWRQSQWLAAGPSASGHVYAGADARDGGYRWKNTPRLGDYLAGEVGSAGGGGEAGGGGGPGEGRGWHCPVNEIEGPDRARGVREQIMTGMRLAEGMDRVRLVEDAEYAAPGSGERLLARAKPYLERGLIVEVEGRWRLSRDAVLRADGIAGDLMRGVVERRG